MTERDRAKHTPGPWFAQVDANGGFIVATCADWPRAGDIVIAHRAPFPHRAPISAANAHLIAAAPDLYEALLPIAAAYSNDPGTSDLYDDQPVTITLGDVRRAWAARHLAEGGDR